MDLPCWLLAGMLSSYHYFLKFFIKIMYGNLFALI